MKHLVKKGTKIVGFVYEQNGAWWYAFGRPSQPSWIAFECSGKENGIELINLRYE